MRWQVASTWLTGGSSLPSISNDTHSTLLQQLWPSSHSHKEQHAQAPPSPSMSPSQSFASLGGPSDQATPRASQQPTANPFDSVTTPGLSKATTGLSISAGRASPAPAGFGGPIPSGLRTPTTHGFNHLPLGTPGAAQPTTGVTVGDTVGMSGGMGFGLHEPPKMRRAMTAADGTKTPKKERGHSPPTAAEEGGANGHAGSTPRGIVNVRLVSARGLAIPTTTGYQPEPYVVIQFEQNEFVSRPPHPVAQPASVPFTTSATQPVNPPGHLSRSTSGLGMGTISRAFAEAVGRGKGKKDDGSQTPRAEEPQGAWFGRPGPGDPVWKEEAAL
jgi:hypothetical protein